MTFMKITTMISPNDHQIRKKSLKANNLWNTLSKKNNTSKIKNKEDSQNIILVEKRLKEQEK